jgi:hypothetical protein
VETNIFIGSGHSRDRSLSEPIVQLADHDS